MTSPIVDFLIMIAWRVPFLLIWIVGFVLALTTYRRHPLASMLCLIAFVLFSASSLLAALFFWHFVRNSEIEGLLLLESIAHTVVNGLAWILILIALFARRPHPVMLNLRDLASGIDPRPSSDQPSPTGIRAPS